MSRPTANSYLNQLIKAGFLSKIKLGKENFYMNNELFEFITNAFHSKADIEADEINSNID